MDANHDGHIPVLLEPIVELMDPAPGQVWLDCTSGRGGHAAALIPQIGPGGTWIGLDLDESNLSYCQQRLEPIAQAADVTLKLVHESFAGARHVLEGLGIGRVDRLLADLGFASNQVDDAQRGLSFKKEGPLDMRLDPSAPTTAADLVNTLPERELADLIYRFGEERLSRRIARRIVEMRAVEPIETTARLAEACRKAYGPRGRSAAGRRIDPATRTFQAMRIAVNGEIDALDRLLGQLVGLLADEGLVGIISFHSLEDRPVKQAFLEAEKQGWAKRITRKPVIAKEGEQARNSRSRSAKLRILQRVGSNL